mgnify:CR=1 FL=1
MHQTSLEGNMQYKSHVIVHKWSRSNLIHTNGSTRIIQVPKHVMQEKYTLNQINLNKNCSLENAHMLRVETRVVSTHNYQNHP